MTDLYRKKPVTVEVMGPLTAENAADIQAWCGGYRQETELVISTLEGQMTASFGDYIIRGVQGEFYPCKPDIFAATYEEARRD